MNQFVIATGSYVVPLGNKAKEAAKEISLVTVNMGDTACKEPDAITYINKAITMGKPAIKKRSPVLITADIFRGN